MWPALPELNATYACKRESVDDRLVVMYIATGRTMGTPTEIIPIGTSDPG